MKIEQCTIKCPDVRVGEFVVCGAPSDTSVMPSLRKGFYEPAIQILFCSMVKTGMTVCDIGANFGQHTVMLSKLVGSEGKVFAIEASPINVEYIKETIRANKCTNVEVIEMGVWSHKTELVFSHVENAEATSFCSNKEDIRTIESNPACKYQTIKVSSLDELVTDPIDFIKIDIEGSELFAMRGAKRFLQSNAPIIVELNSFTYKTFMGVEIVDLIDHMQSNGYSTMYIYMNRQWMSVSRDMILRFFDQGHVLIDVLFSTEEYSPSNFKYQRNIDEL